MPPTSQNYICTCPSFCILFCSHLLCHQHFGAACAATLHKYLHSQLESDSYYISPPFDQSPVYQLDESIAKGSRPPIPKFEPSKAPSKALLRFGVTPAIMFAWATGMDSSSRRTAGVGGCIGACGCDTSVAIAWPGDSICGGRCCGIDGLQSWWATSASWRASRWSIGSTASASPFAGVMDTGEVTLLGRVGLTHPVSMSFSRASACA